MLVKASEEFLSTYVTVCVFLSEGALVASVNDQKN